MHAGEWENDMKHGAGAHRFPNGDSFEGRWEKNKRHINGKFTYASGDVYEGDIGKFIYT